MNNDAGLTFISALFSVVFLAAIVLGYFLPSCVALARKHSNAVPIVLVNTVFGVTVVGWMVALIWSFTDNTKE